MKELYSVKDKTNPSLLGIPTTDAGSTTRYLLNAAVEADSGVSIAANVGTAFSVKVSIDKTVVSGAGASKTTLWVPPPFFLLTSVGIYLSSLEVTTTGGSVAPLSVFDVILGKSGLTSALGGSGVFCAAAVAGADVGWGAGSPPSSFFWTYADSLQNCWINTETTVFVHPGLSGSNTRGWIFNGDVLDAPAGDVHDRFYLSTTSSGGTPAAMTTRYILDVVFTGFLHV